MSKEQFHLAKVNKFMVMAAIATVSGAGVLLSGASVGATQDPHTQSSTSQHSMSQSQTGHAGQSQAAIDLRVGMNNLLREHVSTSLNVTRSVAGHAPQAQIDGAIAAQYANSDALSGAVGSVYGGEAQAQFSSLFREHIVTSNMYAAAVADGDEEAKQMANVELREYLHDIAAFFSGAIPGLQEQDVYGLLNEHEELINKSTDAFKAGDYVQSYQLEREALKQISRAADILSNGIIATQPAKFQ